MPLNPRYWPTFNLADTFLVTGFIVIALVIWLLFERRRARKVYEAVSALPPGLLGRLPDDGSVLSASALTSGGAAPGQGGFGTAVLDRFLAGGALHHIHLNDRNRRAPGQGEDRFAPILAALARHGGFDALDRPRHRTAPWQPREHQHEPGRTPAARRTRWVTPASASAPPGSAPT